MFIIIIIIIIMGLCNRIVYSPLTKAYYCCTQRCDDVHTAIGVDRGCSGCTCTPRAVKKIRRDLQGNFVSAPPAHQVHPQVEQKSILGYFLLGRDIWRFI